MAAEAGAEIIVKARATGVTKSDDGFVNGVVFRYFGRDYTCKAKVVVAADALNRRLHDGRALIAPTTCAMWIFAPNT